jgi:hypothetical protein
MRRHDGLIQTLRCSLFASILLVSIAYANEGGQEEYATMINRATTDVLGNELDALLRGERDFERSRCLVQTVGRRSLREHFAKLRSIAEATAKRDDQAKIAFDALHAISMLDESRQYLLQNAQEHQTNKFLAYYSILILAAEPREDVMGQLRRVREESKDNQIQGALSIAEHMFALSQKYVKTSALDGKMHLLFEALRTGWNPIRVEENEPTGNLNPEAVWAKKEILQLSRKYPAEVAGKLDALEQFDELTRESLLDYRRYVLRFVAEEARAKYEDMEKGALRHQHR